MGTTTWRPLPPVVLRKPLRLAGGEIFADVFGGGGDVGPGERLVGVEVEDDAVGVLEVGVARAPGVDFEDAHLGEAGEGGRGV